MRVTWKQLVNLAVVTILGLVAVTWAGVDLAGINPLADEPRTVHVTLAETGGALPGAEVTYLGVQIGTVEEAEIVPEGVRVRLEVRPRGEMARDLRADVRQKTSLGEPYLDLGPAGSETVSPEEVDGLEVPLERTSTPPPLGDLLRDLDTLLNAIPPEDLAAAIEGGSGIVGHEGDFREVLEGFADFGTALERRQAELDRLLVSSARLTDLVATHRSRLDRALASGGEVAAVLARHREDLASVLEAGAAFGESGSALLADVEDHLDGVLDSLDATTHPLASRPQKAHEILVYTPWMVDKLGRTFEGGAAWSSTQGIPPGPVPTWGIPVNGKGMRLDKIFLPSLARRIEFEGGDFPAFVLTSPEEAERASRSAEDYDAVHARLVRELLGLKEKAR